MIPSGRDLLVTAVSVATVLAAILGAASLGAAPAAAHEHTKETAPDLTEEANFRVEFPFATDHYPGSRNQENGSIQYFFEPAGAFAELGVEDGAYGDYVIIDADWIDYSACDVPNTATFGIDRGNDNDGTRIDVDLVSRMKDNEFRTDGLTISFYEFGDIGGDPPFMDADDAIVAEQGARSSDGACLTVTDEPGWYQVQGFLNGTEADNGPDERPSEDAEMVGGTANSNYLYVCECDSRAEAEEELGRSPGDPGGPSPTPEPGTETPAPDTETPEPTAGSTPTATLEPAATADPGTGTPVATTEPENPEADRPNDANATPTLGEGTGFTGLAALLALLVGVGLLHRRR